MSYNRILAGALLAGAASLVSVSAYAQDEAAPFAGAYIGILGGHSDGSYNVKNAPLSASPTSNFFGGASGSTTRTGGKFQSTGKELGGTIGWSTQSGGLVAGVEGDVTWSSDDGQGTFAPNPAVFSPVFDANTKYTATLRARLGYAFGPVLAYGTAGFARQGVNLHPSYARPTGAPLTGETAARNFFGFAYGAGAEYALTSKVSFKAEYLRLDTGTELFRTGLHDSQSGINSTQTAKVEHDRDLYRIGFNYHF
jgi:outer membrane immunogenic protein